MIRRFASMVLIAGFVLGCGRVESPSRQELDRGLVLAMAVLD